VGCPYTERAAHTIVDPVDLLPTLESIAGIPIYWFAFFSDNPRRTLCIVAS
jgi:hypothetical protein